MTHYSQKWSRRLKNEVKKETRIVERKVRFDLSPISFEDLSAEDFEHYIAYMFERRGYEVYVRGGAGDEGVDVEAKKRNEYFVIQCKRYALERKVVSKDVQILHGAIHANNADKGFLITTGDFTEHARKYAKGKPIELVNYQMLDVWAKRYKVGPYFEKSASSEQYDVFLDYLTNIGISDLTGVDVIMNIERVEFKLNEVNFDQLIWLNEFSKKCPDGLNIVMDYISEGKLSSLNVSVSITLTAWNELMPDLMIELINFIKEVSKKS